METHIYETPYFRYEFLHVKCDGYLNVITDPVTDPGIELHAIGIHIDGGGQIQGTHLYLHALNVTIDSGGHLSSNGLGYEQSHGHYLSGSNYRTGLHGIINPGIGQNSGYYGSGAGHGGSGGRGNGREPVQKLNQFSNQFRGGSHLAPNGIVNEGLYIFTPVDTNSKLGEHICFLPASFLKEVLTTGKKEQHESWAS